MHFPLSFVIAVLPLLAAGSPLQGESFPPAKIAISKRSNVTDADGVVNADVLRRQVTYATGKMERGFNAYKKNMGVKHPLDVERNQSLSARKSASDPLTDDGEQLWYGKISVGTPAIGYTVDFDTGSSDLFLPGPNCNTNCAGHKTYNPSKSSTSSDQHKTFSLSYGDGSSVSGDQYTDVVSIAGLTAKNQRLGAATRYSDGFSKDKFPADGLLGMGFQSISDYNASPAFQSLVSQGQTSQPVFAFKFADSGSELHLGGTDKSLYKGSFTYTPVTQKGYWQVTMQNVKANGKQAVGQLSAIIDSGTTLIIGDSDSVRALYAAIPGSKDASLTVGEGFYTVPCKSIPTVGLTFSGQTFNIAPNIFNLGRVSSGSSDCVGGVVASDIGDQFWIVGDVFLRNVYAQFDFGNARVGFANLA